jgi:hypothetical protein
MNALTSHRLFIHLSEGSFVRRLGLQGLFGVSVNPVAGGGRYRTLAAFGNWSKAVWGARRSLPKWSYQSQQILHSLRGASAHQPGTDATGYQQRIILLLCGERSGVDRDGCSDSTALQVPVPVTEAHGIDEPEQRAVMLVHHVNAGLLENGEKQGHLAQRRVLCHLRPRKIDQPLVQQILHPKRGLCRVVGLLGTSRNQQGGGMVSNRQGGQDGRGITTGGAYDSIRGGAQCV